MEPTNTQQQVITVDATWLNGIQSCMRKFLYYFIENLRSPTTAEPLDKGSLVHKVFEYYYLGRMEKKEHLANLDESIQRAEVYATKLDLPLTESLEVLAVARRCLNHHRDDNYTPLAVERPFSYILYEDVYLKIVMTGVIDLVVDIQGLGKSIVDHKSSSRRSTPSELSNQFINYCVATGLNRAIINQVGFQKTLPDDQKFGRPVLSYTQAVLDEWKETTVQWIKLALSMHKQGIYLPNFTHCDKFGGCMFQRICKTDPELRGWKKKTLFVIGKPWDPYTKDDKDEVVG